MRLPKFPVFSLMMSGQQRLTPHFCVVKCSEINGEYAKHASDVF